MQQRFHLKRIRVWQLADKPVSFVRNESQQQWEIRPTRTREITLLYGAGVAGTRHGGLSLKSCAESAAAVLDCSPRLRSKSMYEVVSSDGLKTGLRVRKLAESRWVFRVDGPAGEGPLWHGHRNEIINRLLEQTSTTHQAALAWLEETISLVESIWQLDADASSVEAIER